jgi:hypothetical protein
MIPLPRQPGRAAADLAVRLRPSVVRAVFRALVHDHDAEATARLTAIVGALPPDCDLADPLDVLEYRISPPDDEDRAVA